MTKRAPARLVLHKETVRQLGKSHVDERVQQVRPTGSCNNKTTNCWTCTKGA
jgi:hypothetical protein